MTGVSSVYKSTELHNSTEDYIHREKLAGLTENRKNSNNLYCSDKVCSAVGNVFCWLDKVPLCNRVCRLWWSHAARTAQRRCVLCDQRCRRQYLHYTILLLCSRSHFANVFVHHIHKYSKNICKNHDNAVDLCLQHSVLRQLKGNRPEVNALMLSFITRTHPWCFCAWWL